MFSVAASPELRDKSELIERFLEIAGFGEAGAQFGIDSAAPESERNWRKFVADSMEDEMSGIIKAEARDRQRHRVTDLLSGFCRKCRSLTVRYPIELPED